MLIGTISPCVCAAAFCVVGHTVNLGGHRIGSYADDTWTGNGGFPEQCRFVADQRRTWPLVIAGMEIGDQNHTCRGAVMALQWRSGCDSSLKPKPGTPRPNSCSGRSRSPSPADPREIACTRSGPQPEPRGRSF